MSGFARFFAMFLLFVTVGSAQALELSGRVLKENGQALANAMVEINGSTMKTDGDGLFSTPATESAVYTVQYSAEGYYPAVHSFSPLDLAWVTTDNKSTVPPVTLVAKKEGRVLLAFGGDAMLGRRFSEPYPGDPVLIREGREAEDTKALLRHVKPYLELADFATVNLETQVMSERPEGNAPKSYVFFTPPEAVAALREAGVDYVTLGNNHTNDYLAEGLDSTLEALGAAGMPYSGAGLNEADSLKAHRSKIGDQAFSFLGYVGWAGNFSPNQVAMGADKSGAAFGTTENIGLTVNREAAAGYMPVIQYHGSREYTDEPTLATETRLKQSIDEGAVLAIAHHPHVTQGFEIYNGRLIAYSMGNFIFDQFHYTTRFSYMLYVWMDGDRFHRAEVVPIHIQGYTPMPATDTVRQLVLKRAYELSARRGLALRPSGGNAVILPGEDANHLRSSQYESSSETADTAPLLSLHWRDWSAPIGNIATGPGTFVRLGMDLLPMGHLENHFLHGSPDRSWIEDGGQMVIRETDGNHVMHLAIPAKSEEGRVGMRTFHNMFVPGTPSTFTVRARVSAPATVTAYQQWRGRNDRIRFEALETNRLRPIGQVRIDSGDWRELRFDFDSPRVSAVSYRVLLRVEPDDTELAHESWFDDISLIEWLTPPLPDGHLPAHLDVGQASHAEIIPR
jgi:poly-gamma-glutamate capsule biosynthesis protein CapA/YwtB (metallophosphatase superfamily)